MPNSRLRTNAAALEFLKLQQTHWAAGAEIMYDSYDRAICRLVLIGWMTGRYPDISSLANDLYCS